MGHRTYLDRVLGVSCGAGRPGFRANTPEMGKIPSKKTVTLELLQRSKCLEKSEEEENGQDNIEEVPRGWIPDPCKPWEDWIILEIQWESTEAF